MQIENPLKKAGEFSRTVFLAVGKENVFGSLETNFSGRIILNSCEDLPP